MANDDVVNANDGVPDEIPSAQTPIAADSTPSSKEKRWSQKKMTSNHIVTTTESFKGAYSNLKGKVFVKGHTQAAMYDEALKDFLTFFGTKYGQRVKRAFLSEDIDDGIKTLAKPKVPMTTIVKQVSRVSW